MGGAPLLSADQVAMAYGDSLVISGLDVHVDQGEILALTGANGCGKSTLLRGLAGLQPMACERFTLLGDASSVSSRAHRAHTFAILDSGAWLRDLTLRDHLASLHARAADLQGVPGSAYTPEQALEALGLSHLADRLPHTLSSGQRQRASLSLGLVRPWSVLFLDEPEQRLDSLFLEIVGDVVRDLVTVGPRAIVMATHSRPLLEACGAREMALEAEFEELRNRSDGGAAA